VISALDRQLDLSTYHDAYREGLQQIIDAKIKGEQIVTPHAETPPKIVNLMDA
jgi:non-homologous end joining protein Ku